MNILEGSRIWTSEQKYMNIFIGYSYRAWQEEYFEIYLDNKFPLKSIIVERKYPIDTNYPVYIKFMYDKFTPVILTSINVFSLNLK